MARRFHMPSTGNVAAGAVVFNPHYDNYARQMQMHQLAKDQALGQYYSKLENSINPAGVRLQDMDDWQDGVQKWQQYAIEHRQALINPNLDGGKSQREFGAMHQGLLGYIQKSKAAAANDRIIQQHMLDPKWRAISTNQDLEIAHRMSLPISNPLHFKDDGITPYSPADFSFNAPPFDEKMQAQTNAMLTKGLKMEKTYGKGVVNQQELKDYVPFTEQHSKSNLKVIGDRMADVYRGTPGVQQFFDNYKMSPEEHDAVNKAYKNIYGDDGTDITTDPQKVAQATYIIKNSQSRTGTEIKGWSRPPQGRAVSQAKQAQQDALNWINGQVAAIRSGNVNEINRLSDLLYAGKGQSRHQGVEVGPIPSLEFPGTSKQGVTFIHQDQVFNPSTGQYEATTIREPIYADDPALPDKVGRIYQINMGSSAPIKNALLNKTVNQPPPPSIKPAPVTPDKDPLGIFK